MTTGRRPVGSVEKNPARRAERPSGPIFDGLTDAELAFRKLIGGVEVRPGRWEIDPVYALECRVARARWEAEHPEHVARVMRDRIDTLRGALGPVKGKG